MTGNGAVTRANAGQERTATPRPSGRRRARSTSEGLAESLEHDLLVVRDDGRQRSTERLLDRGAQSFFPRHAVTVVRSLVARTNGVERSRRRPAARSIPRFACGTAAYYDT